MLRKSFKYFSQTMQFSISEKLYRWSFDFVEFGEQA